MNNFNKDCIKEDVDFIAEYLKDFLLDHPEFNEHGDVTNLIRKIDRRLGDILGRLDG